MSDLPFLDNYSGESTEELLSLEGRYRIDSLVLVFERALNEKVEQEGLGSLSDEERIILAVEALEREVNNGGYQQFFLNSSRHYAPIIVDALARIGCRGTAVITQKALEALRLSQLTAEAIEHTMVEESDDRDQALIVCDNQYFARFDHIESRLFAFIKENKNKIRL